MKNKNLQPILYSLLIIIGIVIGNHINKPAIQSNINNENKTSLVEAMLGKSAEIAYPKKNNTINKTLNKKQSGFLKIKTIGFKI